MSSRGKTRGMGRFTLRVNTEPPPTAPTTSNVGNRRQSIFGLIDSPGQDSIGNIDDLDEYSITLPCQLTDFRPSLRRSMPSIPNGRHMSAGSTGSRRGTANTDSGSENGSYYNLRRPNRTPTANSHNGVVDSAHIHIYLPKRDSHSSVTAISGSSDERPEEPERPSFGVPDIPKPALTKDTWRQIENVPGYPDSNSKIKSHYIGEIVFQIDDFVYCGGLDASLNHNMLCRLNIEFVIDVSGPEADKVARTRTEVPCLCGTKTTHSRTTLSISITDDSIDLRPESRYGGSFSRNLIVYPPTQDPREDLTTYFQEAISCIEKAKMAKKSVLIYSVRCRNRAPAFAAAYLMKIEKLTRLQAVNRVAQIIDHQLKTSTIRPGLCISDSLQRALMRWQTRLNIQGGDSSMDSTMTEKLFTSRRSAWD